MQPALWLWLIPLLIVVPVVAASDLAFGSAFGLPGWLGAGMAALASAHLVSVLVLPFVWRRRSPGAQVGSLVVALTAAAGGAHWVGAPVAVIAAWLMVVVGLWIPGVVGRSFSPGILVFSTYVGVVVVSAVWGALFLTSLSLSPSTTVLLWCAAILTAVCLPSSVVQTYEAWETLLRLHWRRPRLPAADMGASAPSVVIHVPTHAEPPEVVIATLDRLADLDYPRFAVLVIDNNTDDERLWRPVEDHCRQLGDTFAFVHLTDVEGAKAGALNAALDLTPAGVDLIGVVDADYQVQPDWLRRTVGHFADESIAFVQCPHAYRDWRTTRFGRMAEAEYHVFFETSMVAYNERDAALTVGTMSLVRRAVLDEVGGWAEWCLTEDSELSVRIHAAGHSSVYLTEPMGRGLIPDTFAVYRRQRFRWTFGPVQELRAHLRLFLPHRHRRLSLGQLVHHGNHGLDVALIGVRFLAIPVTAAAAMSMVAAGEVVQVPLTLWITATCLVISSFAMRFLVLRLALGADLKRTLGSILAYLSLTYVIQTASLRALFGGRASWERTTKFRAGHHRRTALAAARAETIAGGAALALATAGLVALPHQGVAMMLLIGIGVTGAVYLTSPIVSLVADRDIEKRARRLAAAPTLALMPEASPPRTADAHL
jgi:cellulose synthase/poly-beta-1,6-N-acetylglucosamine synthase-like glycosyltransferase